MCLNVTAVSHASSFISDWILVDRSGKHFGTILNYLRDGSIPLPDNKKELLEIQTEAKFYLMTELVEMIETKLKTETALVPICKVPLITSPKEEQALTSQTLKVNHACT